MAKQSNNSIYNPKDKKAKGKATKKPNKRNNSKPNIGQGK